MQVFTLPQARRGLVAAVDAILTGRDTAHLVWDSNAGELRVVERHVMTSAQQVVLDTDGLGRLIGQGRPNRRLLMPIAAELTHSIGDFEPVTMDGLSACTDPERIIEVLTDVDMWPEPIGDDVRRLRKVVLDIQNRPASAFTWRIEQGPRSTVLHGNFVQGDGPRSNTVYADVLSPWVADSPLIPRSRAHLRFLWSKWPTVSLSYDGLANLSPTFRPKGALAVAIATTLWTAYMESGLIGFLQAQARAATDAQP